MKIFSKIIVERLKPLMRDFVGPKQVSFIPKRQTTNNIIVAQEMIRSLRWRKGKRGAMIVKIDLEKAYNRIDWGILQAVLRKVGVGDSIIKVIMSCLLTTNVYVLWNRQQLKDFKPERGLRQGDPLSPYLFVLCMETLSHSIRTTIESKTWCPCQASRSGPRVSHLFFANDLLLFGEATSRQARVMETILQRCCMESGQKVNLEKSWICYAPNTPIGIGHTISHNFGIPQTKELGSYLGVPLLHGRAALTHFRYLMERIQQKRSGWKQYTLSHAARLILMQTVTFCHTCVYHELMSTVGPHRCTSRTNQPVILLGGQGGQSRDTSGRLG